MPAKPGGAYLVLTASKAGEGVLFRDAASAYWSPQPEGIERHVLPREAQRVTLVLTHQQSDLRPPRADSATSCSTRGTDKGLCLAAGAPSPGGPPLRLRGVRSELNPRPPLRRST